MGCERDSPLWQIEAEGLAHGPTEPRIRARFRRPNPLDERAEHDPIDRLQARFELAVDAHAHAGTFCAPHHAVGYCDLE
jgi:hypothetical protein